ncbi:hypothetical protein RJ640_026254 [Escallonia rubra]|uniref:Uncharacterized protein n=1 Tax=Escallonia rubra TaxID=112253 RepID=A0AA88UHM6_9ASTE|nr:hypothetical protein RJ640_026254 [Escallonia rubra]
MSRVTKETVLMNSNVPQSGRMRKSSAQLTVDLSPIDLNAKVRMEDTNKLTFLGKYETEAADNFAKSRGFGLDLNVEDVSSSANHDPFHLYNSDEPAKSRDASECGSSSGAVEEKDPMKVWKEMKQNGFLSSSHGGVPIPKPRARKPKKDGLKKKLELAKKAEVDRFAKIAAPSGLLNGLNPGIINHVRNSKQVHSIIEALVRSERHENRHAGNKKAKESSEKDLEILSCSGTNTLDLSHEDGSLHILSGSRQMSRYPASSESTEEDDDTSMVDRRFFDRTNCPSHSYLDTEDDILALKLSSSTALASEITSSLSNEESANLTSVTSLSVKAANVASRWLELLHQDIKGRLAALRRSKKRVRAVIQTELPFLMSREFSHNQENDPYLLKSCATGYSNSATADMHRARWSALFNQMDKKLSEEEKHLDSWLNQVTEMQLHCDRGLFQHNGAHGSQHQGTSENDCRLEKADNADNSESDLAVRAAAASIYSTCNFLQSMENLPSFS